MGKYLLDLDKYAKIARQAVAEGCVLLKNDNDTLPLKKNDKVAVFGRASYEYYKSGLGSGGLVNTRYVVGILDALKEETGIELVRPVIEIYEDWLHDHPYDVGKGWGRVPWCQEEMMVTDGLLEAASEADVAIVTIGRTAGEDQDNKNAAGSYLLKADELELISRVSEKFERTVVLLNVGNIIDMKWVDEINPAAVMYVWQGGQEGGHGTADVLLGRVNPCGKLTDTIAVDIDDYPAYPYFGDLKQNFYAEDIYVGYRYFETFAKDNVIYPFGFGLSYTTFAINSEMISSDGDNIKLKASVTNLGMLPGKEVVQVYVKAPQGVLGKPTRVLVDFKKTKALKGGETQELEFDIPKYNFASYDDSSITGYKSCYVLEPGTYEVYVGSDVRSAAFAGEFDEELHVVEKLEEAYAPVKEFKRIRPARLEGGDDEHFGISFEDVPTRTIDYRDRMLDYPVEIQYTGDKGIKLADVFMEKVPIEDFIAQLSDEDLMCIFRGEGMNSPKVTPGTGAAFGGVTESLRKFGIPAACCTDGPSGLRFDIGTKAFSLPNGTMLGCTFDLELVEELYGMLGRELRANRVDALLGPGINIHRHPLNGRNFEYVSEDPLLSGKMGAAQIRGLNVVGSTGTIKHFCANNQEASRRKANADVSERALREIYLKTFEIAIKEGHARAVMTSYGSVNELWTAGSYDLNTTILRNEWGFKGIVMSDWWAESNYEGEDSTPVTRAPMVASGNDVYMVTQVVEDYEQDDVWSKLQAGKIFRCELQRNAKNILEFILKSPAMLYEMNLIEEEEIEDNKAGKTEEFSIDNVVYYTPDKHNVIDVDGCDFITTKKGSIVVGIRDVKFGIYEATITVKSELDDLAQLPVTLFYDGDDGVTFSFRGSNGKTVSQTKELMPILGPNHYIRLYFGADGIELVDFKLTYIKDFELVLE